MLIKFLKIYSPCYSPCVASPARKPTGRPRARRISPWRSPSLFPLFYSNTLILFADASRLDKLFHTSTTLLIK